MIAEGNTTVRGNASLQGLSYGNIFIGRLAARASVEDGTGRFDAALTGRRGSRFELLVNGEATPQRVARGGGRFLRWARHFHAPPRGVQQPG